MLKPRLKSFVWFLVATCAAWVSLGATLYAFQGTGGGGQEVTRPASGLDSSEAPGERPYEIVLANRQPEANPLVDFNSLEGWTLIGRDGADGKLSVSVLKRIWESPTGRLQYQGTSEKSSLRLVPPKPIPVPAEASAVTMWIHGNNWGWVPDPATPQVLISLLLEDSSGHSEKVELTRVRWKEWWLAHRVLAPELRARGPFRLAGLEIGGCGNKDEREIFLENLVFFREEFRPLSFGARPKRGIEPFPGQDVGANVGPGRLPFPTREETILPANLEGSFSNQIVHGGDRSRLIYKGKDIVIEYCLQPGKEFWGPVAVKLNSIPVATALVGAGPQFDIEPASVELLETGSTDQVVTARWRVMLGNEAVEVASEIRILQKSLLVDFFCKGGRATKLSYGRLTGVREGKLIPIPYMNYDGHLLNVVASAEVRPFFGSVWMDWYRSNASVPYTVDEIRDDGIHLNGGVEYRNRTDGKRNDLFERFFVTFSPLFEETLATIPNPGNRRGKEAGTRLWQETWGPQDYEKEMDRSRRLRSYGIEMFTQLNHEITWRDEGESFTFRTFSAPGKGGDDALKAYIKHQKSLGWRSGLYTNYTDFAPVNSYWDPDMVMRDSNGNLITAWPRCYAPKALFAVEMDRKLAPVVQKKFDTTAAYTDVHTAVAPWDRTDYDARSPGAGTFAATFYAFGDLLLHDQQVYDGFCWSEGHHQWLYTGLTTGNYGLTYGVNYRDMPYLPHFDLLKMHPLTVDIGMPWTAGFFEQAEGWNKPEAIQSSIDQYLAATIAYGRMAWLVEEQHGIRQTLRSYYTMQELQSRYAVEPVEKILYSDGARLLDSSEALLGEVWKRSQLYVRYRNGLEVWVNGHKSENWEVELNGVKNLLPPFGWLAAQGKDFREGSVLLGGQRVDQVASPGYLYVDMRGRQQELLGIGTSGAVAVRRLPLEGRDQVEVIAVDAGESISLTSAAEDFGWDDVRTVLGRLFQKEHLEAAAFSEDGRLLADSKQSGDLLTKQGKSWRIKVVPGAVRYVVQEEAR